MSVESGSNPRMNTKHLDSEIRDLIDQFTSKFRELLGLAALGSVQMALEAGVGTPVAPARRGPGRPRGPGKSTVKRSPGRPPAAKSVPGRRVRRSSADVEEVAEQVLGYVRAYPGQRLEEIGRGLGTATAGLKLPVKELVTSGRLRTEGQKRGTKYFAGGGSGGKKAGRRGKAKARRKARKAAARKAGKRGKRKAMHQVAIKPAKSARAGRQRATAKTLSAVAESASAT